MDADALKSVPLFSSLSEEARKSLSTWITGATVSEGKHLVEEGDYSYDLFIIRDGTADLLHHGHGVAKVGPGDFRGEMGVLQKAKRGETVVATSQMQLLVLSSWDVK